MNAKWIFGVLLLTVACGDKEQNKQTPPPQKTEQAAKKPEVPKKVVKEAPKAPPKVEESSNEAKVTTNAAGESELTIEASDAMQFNVKKFTVTAGKKVKITLKHTGEMPKIVMGHNIVVLKPGVDIAQFVAAAQNAAQNDYFPADKADQAVAHSKLIGGGESTTFEFVAPEPGTYKFICSYASHWSMMQGEMVVVAKK